MNKQDLGKKKIIREITEGIILLAENVSEERLKKIAWLWVKWNAKNLSVEEIPQAIYDAIPDVCDRAWEKYISTDPLSKLFV